MFERRQHFLSRARLDPHRADVRAARPRHDVGLDPLSADARRLRRRDPLHRDLGLPADVRPRHHRHGDDRARERAHPAEDAGPRSGSTRRPASSRRAMRRTAPSSNSVRITNVPSFLYGEDYEVEVEGLGTLSVDVAYGGNFYAIVEPQALYSDLADVNPSDIQRWSPKLRARLQRALRDRPSREPGDQPPDPRAVDRQAADAGRHRAQRRVLRRQGDRPLALRHRHLGPHGASRRERRARRGRRVRPRVASSSRPSPAASRGAPRSAITTPSSPRSRAGPASPASTPSRSTTATRSRTASRWWTGSA